MKQHNLFARILCGALSVALLVCLAACGAKETPKTTEPEMISETQLAETTEAPADETTAPEETTAIEETTEAAETQTEAPAPTADEAETAEAEKPKPQTKEEIVALYNESANEVKKSAKSVTSNYTLNTQTSDAVISNKMLQGIANKLISANMGYDKKKDHVTYSGTAEIRNNFPMRGLDWSSKLTAADVTNATCTEKDGVYTVTLDLAPDTMPNIKPGEGHAGKAFSIITKDQIVEGAGSLGMSVIEENSIKLTFKNCRIVAKIDAETGRMQTANYFLDWTLALTAIGIDVSVSFGAEDDFTINW